MRIEEFAPLAGPDLRTTGSASGPATEIVMAGERRRATVWTELLRAVDAEVVAEFTEGLVAGSLAITRRSVPAIEGSGAAW
ncbi:hypothetical protein QT381_04065 [Galbitalea sp. SE-J8]|uniref:hypothetical protein n=1 Tax=Galbitalea sp. SE-J8 TaxID=3054952 RepID=UPI00259D1E83|nr:hypothetical protein [Galbitalea sp. SE-J8]MDM4762180.1 hypothetical protein [Galbitalea sp. SE-J8]